MTEDETPESEEEMTPEQQVTANQLELVVALSTWAGLTVEARLAVWQSYRLEEYKLSHLYEDLSGILRWIGLDLEFVNDDNFPLMGAYLHE